MQDMVSVRISTLSLDMFPKPPTKMKHSRTLKLNRFGKIASVLTLSNAGVGLRFAPMDVLASMPLSKTASKLEPDGT